MRSIISQLRMPRFSFSPGGTFSLPESPLGFLGNGRRLTQFSPQLIERKNIVLSIVQSCGCLWVIHLFNYPVDVVETDVWGGLVCRHARILERPSSSIGFCLRLAFLLGLRRQLSLSQLESFESFSSLACPRFPRVSEHVSLALRCHCGTVQQ